METGVTYEQFREMTTVREFLEPKYEKGPEKLRNIRSIILEELDQQALKYSDVVAIACHKVAGKLGPVSEVSTVLGVIDNLQHTNEIVERYDGNNEPYLGLSKHLE